MGVKGVMVMAEGEHLCMRMREVKNNSKIMTTTSNGVMKSRKKFDRISLPCFSIEVRISLSNKMSLIAHVILLY